MPRRMARKRCDETVRSGDAAQLKALLTQILSTNEGKALAEKLSRFENGK